MLRHIRRMCDIRINLPKPKVKPSNQVVVYGQPARLIKDHHQLLTSHRGFVLSKATSPRPAKRFITCPAKNIMIKQSLTHHAAKNGFARSKMPKAQVGENPRFKLILIYACKNYFCRCCWSECGSYNCRSK